MSNIRSALLACVASWPMAALAQQSQPTSLPAITVEQAAPPKAGATRHRPTRRASAARPAAMPAAVPANPSSSAGTTPSPVPATIAGSSTVPSVAEQRRRTFQTAGSVGFVDADSFKNTYANSLRDVLQESPGVFVQNRYSQELRLSIRGAGITRAYHTRGLEILQDGVPTNLADGSGDYYQIDPLGLRAIEIYKGGNALPFGSSTLGGAINFVTPTARTVGTPSEIRIDGGSFGTGRVHVQTSKVMGDWDYFIGGTLTHADGWRSHETQNSGQFNANIGYRLNANVETRFFLGAYVFNQKLPGTLSLFDALHNPRKASAAAVAGDQARDTQTYRLANRTTVQIDSGRIDLDTWFIHKNLYHPIFQALDQNGATFGIAPKYTGSFAIGGFRNDVVLGARVWGGDNTALQYLNIGGLRGAQTLDSVQKAQNYEAYGENRFYMLPSLALVSGLKILRSVRDYTDHGGIPVFDPTPKSASRTFGAANPKVGLLFEPLKDVQLFADITRSVDVPDFSDLNQTIGVTNTFVPLRPQKAWTGEVGTRGSYGPLSWDLTFYRSAVRDELLNFTVNPSVPAATFNARRTTHQGVEFGGSAEILHDLTGPASGDTLSAGLVYTYSDFRFDNDAQYGNNRIAGVPTHVFRGSLTYTNPAGFFIKPTVDWVPQGAFVDFANTKRVPGYVLVGLQGGYTFRPGVSVYVDARNLGNKRYISDLATVTTYTPTYASFYPGAGRSVFAGVRYQF